MSKYTSAWVTCPDCSTDVGVTFEFDGDEVSNTKCVRCQGCSAELEVELREALQYSIDGSDWEDTREYVR